MVWQIVNNLDVENAKKIPLSRRSPFIEYKGHFSQEFVDQFEVSSANQFEESNEETKGGLISEGIFTFVLITYPK